MVFFLLWLSRDDRPGSGSGLIHVLGNFVQRVLYVGLALVGDRVSRGSNLLDSNRDALQALQRFVGVTGVVKLGVFCDCVCWSGFVARFVGSFPSRGSWSISGQDRVGVQCRDLQPANTIGGPSVHQ